MIQTEQQVHFNFNPTQINSWCISYNQYIQNKIKNKLRIKAIIMYASNWEKKTLEVLKRIKTTLSTP